MGIWQTFVMPCIYRLQDALNEIDLTLYSDTFNFNFWQFLKIFCGGVVVFNALLWGVSQPKKKRGKQ